jgi:acyl-CoA dehydrogenase
MVDFTVPEEIRDIGDGLVEFVRKVVEPLEEEHRDVLEDERRRYTEDGRYSQEVAELRHRVRTASAEAGYYNLYGSEELGGAGVGPLGQVYLQALLHKTAGPERILVLDVVTPSAFTNGLSPVLSHLRPDVLERYIDGIRAGVKTMCFALSEPDAGSDVFAMRSYAVQDGDDWILHGTKQWITNSPYADYCMVFVATDRDAVAARTGEGVTGFFVDTTLDGFSVPDVIPLMGQLGADIATVNLDGVRVPGDHVIGEVGKGLQVALGGVSRGRLGLSAGAIGQAEWALAKAVDYAQHRIAFGRPIAEQQAIQLLLADSALDIYAAKNMVWHCAWKIEQGEPARKETSMVKVFCTEMLFRVMDRAINVHGAMGLTNEVRLEAGLRWARTIRVPDGTSEIQRRTIARQLLAGDLAF